MLKRRREFAARGPIPPWWRRPGVLTVLGLLVVGGGLAASETVNVLVSSQQVRETSAAMARIPLPDGFDEWQAACGINGLRCAQTAQSPEAAVDAFADRLRELGHAVEPARCGSAAPVLTGTTLATMTRHDGHCATTTDVRGGVLTVAAWDHVLSASGGGDGLPLGRTAVVVEWDAAGTELLMQAEPDRIQARFADVRVTPEEIAALPGGLADAECVADDAEGCQLYEVTLDGPGEGRDLLEARAGELLDAGFLVMTFQCDESAACSLMSEAGRADGEQTRIAVQMQVEADNPGRVLARIHTA